MAQIDKPNLHFNTLLYTGTGSSNSQTGLGFQPDWLWIKRRSATNSHHIVDAVRGVGNAIASDLNNAEYSSSVSSFDSDGFTVTGNAAAANNSSSTYAAWNWKANGAGSSNTDGSINTTSTSVNTTSGFSISSYTGTGSAATIGHGLGSTPKMIIVKCRSNADTWAVYHESVGATKYMELDTTAVAQTSTQPWNDTAPTSSLFTVGNWSATNGSGRTYIAYCFAEKKGFSKFGEYTGNGSTNGPFIYTGFKPAFIIYKGITGSADNWEMHDIKRETFNPVDRLLYPNATSAESDPASTTDRLDIVSNGFKMRTGSADYNNSGTKYLYIAFAENPIVGSNNIPAVGQ